MYHPTVRAACSQLSILICLLFLPSIAWAQFTDDFERPDGTELGNGWVEKNPDGFVLSGGKVVAVPGELGGYRDNIVHRPAADYLTDVEASVEVKFNRLAGYPQVHVRVQGAASAAPDQLSSYFLYINDRPDRAVLARQLGDGFPMSLGVLHLDPPLNTEDTYRLRLQAIATLPIELIAFVERKVGAEWERIGDYYIVELSWDQIQLPGGCGFSGFVGDDYTYDNFSCQPLHPCVDLDKDISVDGGVTWLEANKLEEAPLSTGGVLLYRYRVSNACNLPLQQVIILDESLEIDVDIGDLAVGESVTRTHNDAGFENLVQENVCGPTCAHLGEPAYAFPYDDYPDIIDEDYAWVRCCHKNQAPVAICGGQVYVEVDDSCDWSVDSSAFNLASYDPDGDPLTFNAAPTSGSGEAARTATLTVSDPCGDSNSCYVRYEFDQNGELVLDANGDPIIVKHTMVVPVDSTPPVITVDNPVVTFQMNDESMYRWPRTWRWPTNVRDACGLTIRDNCTSTQTVNRRWGISNIQAHDPDETVTWDHPYEGYYRSDRGIFAGTTEFSICLDRNRCVPRRYTLTISALDAPYPFGNMPREPNEGTATCDIVIVDN